MKLSKLLTAIPTVGVVVTTTPLVLTSCSEWKYNNINLLADHTPKKQSEYICFETFKDMNRAFSKLARNVQIDDMIWDISEALKHTIVSPEAETWFPFKFKQIDTSIFTLESWHATLTSDGYLDISFEAIFTTTGITSATPESKHLPDECIVSISTWFSVDSVIYSFKFPERRDHNEHFQCAPVTALLPTNPEWNVAGSTEVILSHKEKEQTVSEIDTLSVFWDKDHLYNYEKPDKSYLYDFMWFNQMFSTYYFDKCDCNETPPNKK